MNRSLGRRGRIAVGSAAVAALLAAGLAPAAAAGKPDGDVAFWLTVNHNNDGESVVSPRGVFDDDDNLIGTQGGVAYFASALKGARAAANCWRSKREKSVVISALTCSPFSCGG